MRNLFTFGCSHTNHCYPTWANILGEQFENHYNFGRGGSGPFYSFSQIINIIQNKEQWNIREDDYFVWLVTEENRQDFVMYERHNMGYAEHILSDEGQKFTIQTDNWYNNSDNWWTKDYLKNIAPMDGLLKTHMYIYTIKELLEKNHIKHKIILALDGLTYLQHDGFDKYYNDIKKIIGEFTSLQSISSLNSKELTNMKNSGMDISIEDEMHYHFLEQEDSPILVKDGHWQIPIHIEFLRKNFHWFKGVRINQFLEIHEKCKTKKYTANQIYKALLERDIKMDSYCYLPNGTITPWPLTKNK